MKKRVWTGAILILLMLMVSGMSVCAQNEKTVVALGADLSAEQRSTVLSMMELTEQDLEQCEVITITNAMEHQYLDSYVDASVIGSKSLTSVKLVPAASGSGIQVTTRNVNYCTTSMYRNALLTAGVEDVDVYVIAPTPVSGTAGLVGAIKAYEKETGANISQQSVDTALEELVVTGDIVAGAENVSDDEVEALMAWLKNRIASGDLQTNDESSIRSAIADGEKEFGVKLDESEKNRVVELLKRLDKLGLNGSYLMEQAEQLYAKYGMDIVNHTSEAINEAVSNAAQEAASSFFDSISSSVKNFFSGLFK